MQNFQNFIANAFHMNYCSQYCYNISSEFSHFVSLDHQHA